MLTVPGAILMPWSTKVAGVLINFMPGQQAGHAIADVLFAKTNPSGKLPLTMPNKENEEEFTPEQWPGLPDPSKPVYVRPFLYRSWNRFAAAAGFAGFADAGSHR